MIHGADLRLGSFVPRLAGPVGLDFEQVNAPLRAQGLAEVDAILGADVFDAHGAVIDYSSMSLFLRVVASEPAAAVDGQACQVSREPLAAIEIVGLEGDLGVERKTGERGAQLAG